jgi:hypothetical protein
MYIDELCSNWYENKLNDPSLYDRLVTFYVYVYSSGYSRDSVYMILLHSIQYELLPRLSNKYSLITHKGFYKKFIKYIKRHSSITSMNCLVVREYLSKIPAKNNYHYFEYFMDDYYEPFRFNYNNTYVSKFLLKLFVHGSTNPKKYMYRILTKLDRDVINKYSDQLMKFLDLYGENEFISLMILCYNDENVTHVPLFKEYLDQCEPTRLKRITDKAATLLSKSDEVCHGRLSLIYQLRFNSVRLKEFIIKFNITSDIIDINFDNLNNDQINACIDLACENTRKYYQKELLKEE